MPLIIYIFALCVFAIGFTEFITIGLLSTIAASLHTDITQAGLTVTLYAAGVVVGATLLTTSMANSPRKNSLLFAIIIFTIGNILAGISTHLSLLIVARIIAGLGHGLFISIAASVVKQLVPSQKIGSALALIFSGISIAMSFGVPASTWLSTLLPWRYIFFIIAFCGLLGTLGIVLLMPKIAPPVTRQSIKQNLAVLSNKFLVSASFITILTYAGSFALYSFINPVLEQITHINTQQSSLFLLIYGFGAFIGNIIGGKMTDHYGINKTTVWFIVLMALSLIWIGFTASFVIPMFIGCLLLGCFTYGIIPPIQARMLFLATKHTPESLDIASGISIAAFNFGLIFGSGLGMLTLTYGELSYLAWIGTLCCIIAGIYFIALTRTNKTPA